MGVNFDKDLPNPNKEKEVIFYQSALKIYGALPYILSRKLKAKFISSCVEEKENNFTIVEYRQKTENVQALTNWLYKDAGFIWAMCNEKLHHAVGHELPEIIAPTCTFQQAISQMFGVVVETPEREAPKPWNVVLGGVKHPKSGDAVLGSQYRD